MSATRVRRVPVRQEQPMKIQLPMFAFALCVAVATASAQSYRWVDKDEIGRAHV